VNSLDNAIVHLKTGDLVAAERIVSKFRRNHSDDPRALEILATIRFAQTRYADAVRLVTSVLEQDAARPDAWDALGTYVLALGEPIAAAAYHREALRRAPRHPFAQLNLANALARAGDFAQAVPAFEAVLELDSKNVGALTGLGLIAQNLGQLDAAEVLFSQAVQSNPQNAVAWSNLGAVWSDAGRTGEAEEAYRHAIEVDPNAADAWLNLGHLHLGQSHADEATPCYRRSQELQPGDPRSGMALGHALAAQGESEAARSTFHKLSESYPAMTAAASLRKALTIPIISNSAEEIRQTRERVQADLLAIRGIHLDDPVHEVGVTPFYFAFHGQADACLNADIADAFLRACPSLATVAPHLDKAPRDRPRVGVLSAYLKHHTIGKFMEGFLTETSPDVAEIILIRTQHQRDAFSERLDVRADRVVHLSDHLAAAQSELATLELDTLIYPEVGMDPMTYALSYGRWARRSLVFWGHPVSPATGGIDSFITSDLLERPGSERDYAEDLHRWPVLPTYYRRPDVSAVPPPEICRIQLGIPDRTRLYLCPQSLFKLHPDFDCILEAIIARDPHAKIGLIDGLSEHWRTQLEARWTLNAPTLLDRVVWFKRTNEMGFIALLRAADVVMDPIHFGGGNTSYEAFALGVPIVTWPGSFLRSRVTQAAYRQMGFAGPIASSVETYVDLAYNLANQPDQREWYSSRIRDRADALYADPRALACFGEACQPTLPASQNYLSVAV